MPPITTDPRFAYWEECIAVSFDENGIAATQKQIESVAADVQNSHENIGMAFHTPENPMVSEVSSLREQLKAERDKILCPVCRGSGSIITRGGTFECESQCDRCRGEGRCRP